MDLIIFKTVDDRAPGLLQLTRKINVVLFVKPSPKLNDGDDFLAALSCRAQCLNDL